MGTLWFIFIPLSGATSSSRFRRDIHGSRGLSSSQPYPGVQNALEAWTRGDGTQGMPRL